MREKKRVVFIVVLLEAILVAAAIFPLFGKDAVYELGPERMRVNFGTVMQDGWLAVDESAGQAGVMADFEQISLPAGGYRVKLRYQSDTDMKNLCTVTDEGGSFGLIQSDVGQVFAGLSETDFNIWLFRGTDDLGVHVSYGGVGAFKVLGLVIEETNALARMRLFTLLCLIALADAVWLWAYRGKRRGIPLENKDVCFGLFLIILLSSLPLFTDYLVPEGGDLGYHLMRIEGIKDGLLAGQFPVRIAPNWQFGFGYASSVFYGETLLYPAALLRLVGFPVQTSYQIYLFLVNVATALAAYGCFSRLFGQKQIGLLCSGLYTLSVYRIYRTYCFGALGETLAMLFLPLLVYGFYRVFAWDVSKEGYQKGWIPLTAGFAGLVQTHLLTCELVGVFTVLLCILLWKRLFRKETFLVLAKAALFSALLSAWFLVPFLDYMLRGDFVIQHVAGRTIQSRGLYLSHHLMTFLHRGGNGFFDATGLKGSDPAGIGAALLAVLLAWVYFRSRGKLREALDAQEMAFGKVCAWLGGFAILASCAIFPWDRIQSLGGIVQTLVSSLQFPHRFLIIATVLLAALAGTVAKGLWKKGEKAWLAGYCGGLAVLVLCSSVFLLDDILYQSEPLRVYGSNGLGTGYVAGGEYLPYGTDASLFTYHDPIANGVTVQGYRRDLGAMEMDCENAGSQEGTVELALLYYQGYRAYDTDTGEMIPILDGLNHSVTLVVPAGYQGHVRVAFHSPWHWRVAELVSVAAFVLLLLTRGGLPRKKGLLRKSS